MERVLVVGCAGAGKTTFSRELSRVLKLPMISLDRHFWLPGWVESDIGAFTLKIETLAENPQWIMDGNYGRTLAARMAYADTVVFLDMPRMVCLWRVIFRTVCSYGRTREDMAEGCPERFDWEFLKYIWHFNALHRPRLEDSFHGFVGRIVILKSRKEVEGYFAAIGKS